MSSRLCLGRARKKREAAQLPLLGHLVNQFQASRKIKTVKLLKLIPVKHCVVYVIAINILLLFVLTNQSHLLLKAQRVKQCLHDASQASPDPESRSVEPEAECSTCSTCENMRCANLESNLLYMKQMYAIRVMLLMMQLLIAIKSQPTSRYCLCNTWMLL